MVPAAVEMVAEAQGEGIGGIVIADLEAQEAFHHQEHLGFAGLAIADDGLFEDQGGIFIDGEVGLAGGQEDDAPDLAELNGALDIMAQENRLYGHGRRAGGYQSAPRDAGRSWPGAGCGAVAATGK